MPDKKMTKGAGSLKLIISLLAGAALGVGAYALTKDQSGSLIPASLESQAQMALNQPAYNTLSSNIFQPTGFAGQYLSGFHAQSHHDWKNANQYMQQSLSYDGENPALIKRAIMLAIGSGNYERAFQLAHKLSAGENDESIGELFLAVEALKKEDYAATKQTLDSMTNGGIADFVKPLLYSWMEAAKGELNTVTLRKNAIHMSHGILIAHYLKNNDQTENLMAESLALGGITVNELKRMAEIYLDIGRKEKAEAIFEQLSKVMPTDPEIKQTLAALKEDKEVKGYSGIASAQDGVALALYDMAKLFYQENSDDSAHIFAQMSLYLNPVDVDTHIMLAGIAARNERYDEAIAYYDAIKPESSYYTQAQREIANLLEESGRTDKAIAALQNLAEIKKDKESLISIGDIYRRSENFPEAIAAYNRAEKEIGKDKILPDYWHLYYVRGMALERNGDWALAEKDLVGALEFNPNHPYVLNYLGYAWADKGENLDKARDMIKKAAALQPEDGYITDSLGWILYRDGNYTDAVKYLEKAVELLPYDAVINDHLGDAYWKTGRRLEAKFQWERAKNSVKNDDTLLSALEVKLENGLPANNSSIMQANNASEEKSELETKTP